MKEVIVEQILYRIKKYSEEALHYPAGTFHHQDALRLLGLAIADFQAAQQSVQRIGGSLCECGVDSDPEKFGQTHLRDCPANR